jgi:hypothetical protein
MSKKFVVSGLAMVIGLSLLSACGNVGSVGPNPGGAHTANTLCSDTPKQPACN